ncbi:MAG: RsmE family RNA methyltransferase [Thermodesulfobacteriota bacterium]
MRRFFIEDLTSNTAEAVLRGEELRHLKVLRLTEGEVVSLFNGRGLELLGRIISLAANEARLSIIKEIEPCGESPLNIILLAGLSKANKPELIIQKATELGVSSIVFYSAGRSVPGLKAGKADNKLKRWRRVALEAVKQCRRSIIPLITFEDGLARALAAAARVDVKLFFYEGGGRPAREILSGFNENVISSAALLIGPEGGFTETERGAALSNGFIETSLGPRILRAETAAIVSVALVQSLLEDF